MPCAIEECIPCVIKWSLYNKSDICCQIISDFMKLIKVKLLLSLPEAHYNIQLDLFHKCLYEMTRQILVFPTELKWWIRLAFDLKLVNLEVNLYSDLFLKCSCASSIFGNFPILILAIWRCELEVKPGQTARLFRQVSGLTVY